MTKYEWETELKKCMHRLPKAEQDKVLEYYNELFADQAENGRSEKQIINEFGNPSDVAFKIMTDYGMDVSAVGDERRVAPPEFYTGSKADAKEGDVFGPPDFWAGRGAAVNSRAAVREQRQAAKEESGLKREESFGVKGKDLDDSGAVTKSVPQQSKRSCASSVIFLIEILIFGGVFIGVASVIISLAFSVLAIGYATAAGGIYAVICGFAGGVEFGVRLVSFAVALFMLGLAAIIVPNTVRIVKGAVKLTKSCWNLFFGWFTKKREAK